MIRTFSEETWMGFEAAFGLIAFWNHALQHPERAGGVAARMVEAGHMDAMEALRWLAELEATRAAPIRAG